QVVKPAPTQPPSEHGQRVGALLARREQPSAILVAEKNRLGTASAHVRPSLDEHVTWLKKQLKHLDKEVDAFITATPDLKEKDDFLQEVQGIGKKTAAKLIADVPELGACDRKQIAALIGTALYDHDSGYKKCLRDIWGGCPDYRKLLCLAR